MGGLLVIRFPGVRIRCISQVFDYRINIFGMRDRYGNAHGDCSDCSVSGKNRNCWGYQPVEINVRTFEVMGKERAVA